ncbi:MAG: 23S rRNA (uracil1939-C5)-methyltransferase [Paracoccaceae bacterium]|jgi:23S rRNA (uracil1939-C5)-methyltransferase
MTSLIVKRLGHHGDGIAKGPNGDIFAPYVLPDEEIDGDIEGGRISIPRVLTASADRVKAPCSHFKSCGGCALQHASDGFLADWKIQLIRSALAAHDIEAAFRPIATSSPKTRRRANLAGRRTKKGALVGLNGKASNTILPIPNCTLLHPDILAAIPVFEELTVLGASRKNTIGIAVTLSENGLDVDLQGVKPADGPLLATLGGFCETHRLARLSWNSDVIAQRVAPLQIFGTTAVIPPPGAFLQATQQGQSALTDAVNEIVKSASRVVDVFAGCGTFSLPLAQNATVHAVEGEETLLAALEHGHRANPDLNPLTTEVRDLFRRPLLAAELNKFDAVVIDPPRAGAKAQTAELVKSGITKIAFVSCNPITFARDAAVLIEGGFQIDWIKPIDQFRWSPHVELVAAFSRN